MKKRKKHSKLITYLYIGAFLSLLGGVIVAGFLAYFIVTLKIPDLKSFDERKVAQSTKIYDRTGNVLLWDVHQNIRRTVVPFDKISRNIKNATVAIEDSYFYQHHGIRPLSLLRAFLINLSTGSVQQGGSTITQQLIKNALLTREKSMTRKIKEIVLTLKAEKMLTKDEILNLYLNEIPYGGNMYGIESACQNFFGKHSDEVTLAESAYLAALPQAPSHYSPYGPYRNELETRKNVVLRRMRELGFITEEEERAASQEKVVFLPRGDQPLKAPHFSLLVRAKLEEKYGKEMLEQGGLKVITTLDYDLQQKAEKIVADYAAKNEADFEAYNAGLVAIDPKTGQILTMVGSRNWYGTSSPAGCIEGVSCHFEPQPNVTYYGTGRQPGSSIKPFVYATTLKKGYTPETILFDLRTEFNSSCNPDSTPKPNTGTRPEECYSPVNYDDKYRGPMTIKSALAQSINIPAVKALYLAGLQGSLNTMRDMGITTLNDPNRYGLTLVLGGGEVTLLEMTGAYSVFANSGVRNSSVDILKIEDSDGRVLEEFTPHPQQALDKNIALQISDILSDNQARVPSFSLTSPLAFYDRPVAAKTGTTNDYRDAWILGYTPNIAVGVWAGNNDNTPFAHKVAGYIAAPIWRAFLDEAFKNLPREDFEKPALTPKEALAKPFLRGDWQGGETYLIDSVSGKRATQFTPTETLTEKTIVNVHSILYWIDKNNPLGPRPQNPENDSQFDLWEKPVRDWTVAQKIQEQTVENLPQDYDDVHKPEFAPKINIITPVPNTTYNPNTLLKISFSGESRFGLNQVDFFLENTYLGSSTRAPFDFSFVPQKTLDTLLQNYKDNNETIPDTFNIKIIAYDKMKNKTELTVPVRFNIAQN